MISLREKPDNAGNNPLRRLCQGATQALQTLGLVNPPLPPIQLTRDGSIPNDVSNWGPVEIIQNINWSNRHQRGEAYSCFKAYPDQLGLSEEQKANTISFIQDMCKISGRRPYKAGQDPLRIDFAFIKASEAGEPQTTWQMHHLSMRDYEKLRKSLIRSVPHGLSLDY